MATAKEIRDHIVSIKKTHKITKAMYLISSAEHPATRLFVVGDYGRRYFMQRSIPIETDFRYSAKNPTMEKAREICNLLLSEFIYV